MRAASGLELREHSERQSPPPLPSIRRQTMVN